MVNVRKGKKGYNKIIEFLAIFSMCFGLMIGSGLYLKNSAQSGGVLGEAHQFPVLAICIWIIIGLTATLMMMVFIEGFTAFKPGDHSTVQSLGNKFIGRRMGSFLSVYYLFVYTPILTSIGALYVTDVFFDGLDSYIQYSYALNHGIDANGLNANGIPNLVDLATNHGLSSVISDKTRAFIEICVGLGILTSFAFLNGLTKIPSKYIQTGVVALKIIPIGVAIVGGIYLATKGVDQNVFDRWKEYHGQTDVSEWIDGKLTKSNFNISMVTILSAAVPAMFSFNGFADGAGLQKDVEHKKIIAPALATAIIATTGFYIIITIIIFLSGNDGNIFNLYQKLFKDTPAISFIIRIAAAITVISLVNAYTAVGGPQIQAIIEQKMIYWRGDKEISHFKGSMIQYGITLILTIFYIFLSMCITWSPSSTGNYKQYDFFYVTNTLSDLIAIIAFTLYFMIMVSILVNRKTKKVEVRKMRGAFWMGIIASTILGFELCFLYIKLYVLSFISSITADVTKSVTLTGVFTGLGIIIAILYFMNEWALKKYPNKTEFIQKNKEGFKEVNV